ncbi:2OG-Fe(II) oxygenase, partial [Vibrio parahaemolyticus]
MIAHLRPALYAHLQSLANRWNEAMGIDIRYPAAHASFLKRCHEAG